VEEDMKSFVPKKYHKYKDIFMKSSFNALPEHSKFDHAINLTDDFTPQKSVIYKLSPLEQQELNKFLDKNLSTGHIQHFKSKQAAPFFFAKKAPEINALNQNPGLRPIINYHYLNAHTIKDRYSLPLLEAILKAPKLQTATVFTVLDIHWGFNNLQIKEGDEWKAAFITNRGVFKPTVMFFAYAIPPLHFSK
jgi:hypothetical protein